MDYRMPLTPKMMLQNQYPEFLSLTINKILILCYNSENYKKLEDTPIKIRRVRKSKKGFGVFTQVTLQKNTIIAEYLGDMITTEEYDRRLLNGMIQEWGSNSRFTLMKTSSRNSTLEIIPQYHSNIARFLNSASYYAKTKNTSFENNVSVNRV